jgi:DNA-binding PadR family transcriptional regulator
VIRPAAAARRPAAPSPQPAPQRLLKRGDLRLLILELLTRRPRHGYDVMTALGRRFHGLYRPSPGAVYPILGALAEEGLVAVTPAAGRRVFSITPKGRQVLRSEGAAVQEIQARLATHARPEARPASSAVLRELERLERALVPTRHRHLGPDELRRAQAILRQARIEVEALARGEANGPAEGGS